jgi:hypothetical protein
LNAVSVGENSISKKKPKSMKRTVPTRNSPKRLWITDVSMNAAAGQLMNLSFCNERGT